MTIGEAIRKVDEMQPNSFSRAEKIAWLRQLDMELWREVCMTHEGWEAWAMPDNMPDYDEDTEAGRQLIVPDGYDSIYLHWLQSRIDYALRETAQYNNSNAAFEADRQAYRNWYNRKHMPRQVKERWW